MTHDSFFSSSRVPDPSQVSSRAVALARDGASILDIGGESTRPGSEYVSLDEELRRVIPAVTATRQALPDIDISVDTRKAPVAEAALDAGATMINDISGLRDDPDLARLVAERDVPVCLMHMQGTPAVMQDAPDYQDVVHEVCSELARLAETAITAGIREEQILLDPGVGFGKTFSHNWSILKHLSTFREIGFPLLVGLSRKSFLGAVADGTPLQEMRSSPSGLVPPEERLYPTLAAHIWCTLQEVAVLRVHDVRPTVEALGALKRILSAE